MDKAICELSQRLSCTNKSIQVSLTKERLSQFKNSIYDLPPDHNALQTRPWRNSPKYFTQVLISTVALVKMSVHAKLGGSIEVMGMLTGKIVRDMFIVMDVYSLPVEGTETRVNAQSEAYEYMVQYLDLLKEVDRKDSIVGWYHLHPGYGCWLSGIDVATQSLNQSFQDPYLAIVVDPVQTMNQSKVEIGAFRAFPVGYQGKDGEEKESFGAHSSQYYALDIKLFKGPGDGDIIDAILNKSWVSNLLKSSALEHEYQKNLTLKAENLMKQDVCTASLVRRDLPLFNSMFELMIGEGNSQKKDTLKTYFGRSLSKIYDEAENESDELKQDMEDIEEDSEKNDKEVDSVESRKGTKRNLLSEDKAGIYFESSDPTRKRFATEGDNELKHQMQSLHIEWKASRKEASNIGQAELLRLLYYRAQQRVFGAQSAVSE